jgi:hypothetical protein
MKVFDLDREESALLMGGIASPFLKRMKNQTFLRILPLWAARRFNPTCPLGTVKDSGCEQGENTSLQTNRQLTFTRLMERVLTSRFSLLWNRWESACVRFGIKIAALGFFYSILKLNKRFRHISRHLGRGPSVWIIILCLLILASRGKRGFRISSQS